ncbi:MAG: ABC transporter permease [Kosmotoga sp.]|uniref:ABC transporter permease n=1 Tax=Kosmotoga sp. TaxID=1955248 RepID=UPI001DF33300|nr:ABC transporter permease [Kosmotoga sp.]MBO8166874.1 ABC transporter permease [Kosmotoga sp.]
MKRLLKIFERDLKNSIRDSMLLYILIAPILLALLLRAFIPAVKDLSIEFGAVKPIDQTLVKRIEMFAPITLFDNTEKLMERIEEYDDFLGIRVKDEEISLIAQGNESEEYLSLASDILSYSLNPSGSSFTFGETGLGRKLPPVSLYGFVLVILGSFLFGGMIIGFNIIEEKEGETLKALRITPMSNFEFIAGRSLIGFFAPIFHAFVVVWILGISDFNPLMLLALTISGSLIGIVFGFWVGVISTNQMNGIANMKISFFVLVLPVFLAITLPEKSHIFLYWAPTYWTFISVKNLLLQLQTWPSLLKDIGLIVATSMIFVLATFKKIRAGLLS